MSKNIKLDRHKNRTRASEAARHRMMNAASLDIPEIRELTKRQKARRAKCTKSAADFIATYCTACPGGFLKIAPNEKMRGIIDIMQIAVTGGTHFHIRMPRGHGKTSYVKGVVMWALATGRRHFVEVVGASGKKGQAILRDIWNCISRSPKFAEDFPEIREPIDKLEGKTNRAKSVTVGGEPTNIKKSADEFNLPTVADSPSSGAICIAVGFGSNVRGAVFGSVRPDLIVFDDLQDAEMAKSEERVAEAMDMIRGDFLGSGSHMDDQSAFMTSTPIQPGDLSEAISADKTWRTVTYTMVEAWPREWIARRDEGLWGEYARLWKAELANDRPPQDACNAFYLAHRAEMDDGAAVLNDANFKPSEISAVQHAMNLFFESGEKVFDAEYQMKPRRHQFAFEISAKLILSRVRAGLPALTKPGETFRFTAAATDINPSYALTTAVVSFDISRTAVVVYHAITPIRLDSRINDTAFHQEVYNALAAHGRALANLGFKIDAWGIDAGGKQFKPVTAFAPMSRQLCGISACAMVGRSSMKFSPLTRSRLKDAINATVLVGDPGNGAKWIFWDADQYKEAAQRSWASDVGAPGGLSMYDGKIDHSEFAIQIANEKLVAKRTRADGRNEYSWKTAEPHDYGDCVAMCYAIAGSEGLSGETATKAVARRSMNIVKHKPRIRVV